MIKYLIILLNIIGLIGIKVLFPGGISVTSDMPESVKAGDEFVITVRIDKGELSGFAKFTQELPQGFTATLVSSSDATFSFKDNKVKFIWVSLPVSTDFSFSYKVKVNEGVSGNFNIGGVFAYIFDNEKQTADLESKTLTVGTTESMAQTEAPIKGYIEEEITKVQCKRTTSVIPGLVNTFKVELRIDKPGINGFAKIEESIPDGFYASELENDGGVFSFTNQLVKILWMAMPDKEQFIVSYKLTSKNDVSGNQKIVGAFSYLSGNESIKYFIASSTIFIEHDEGDDVPTIIIADEGGDFKEKEVVVAPVIVPEPVVEPDPIEEKVVAVIPEPQSDVTYKVQVAAGHTPVGKNYFASKFNLNEDISIENHQGWIKYTFGDFNVYKDCRDKRNYVWNSTNITDAFVTAYNAGKRITVQEALMISNQKWFN